MTGERPATAAPTPAADDGGPVVALPARGLSGGAIAGIVGIAAALLLVTLNLRRTAAEQPLLATSGTATFAPAPPLPLPRALPPADDGPPRMVPPWRDADPMAMRPRYAYRPMTPVQTQSIAPTRYTMSAGVSAAAMPPPYVPGQAFRPAAPPAEGEQEGNSALVIDIGRDPAGAKGAPGTGPNDPGRPIRATLIANRASLVGEGTIINATLETSIDSTRPGMIRAIVGEDVRSFDGKRVLIPRGARLTGEYRADVQSGQRRVLATWTRLIRPDGVAVRIDSPAADRFGGAGIPGRVESNFLQRFATAILQSALNVGVNLASRSNGSTVIIGPAGGAMTQVLPTPAERRSITVPAGKPVSVFVARDLDFSQVPGWR